MSRVRPEEEMGSGLDVQEEVEDDPFTYSIGQKKSAMERKIPLLSLNV
jgi:hypothetical protein